MIDFETYSCITITALICNRIKGLNATRVNAPPWNFSRLLVPFVFMSLYLINMRFCFWKKWASRVDGKKILRCILDHFTIQGINTTFAYILMYSFISLVFLFLVHWRKPPKTNIHPTIFFPMLLCALWRRRPMTKLSGRGIMQNTEWPPNDSEVCWLALGDWIVRRH